MNNLKLEFNLASVKALLPVLKQSQVVIYGLLLIGVFGYTAYAINQALNIQPAGSQSAITALPKITFDKKTMESLQDRTVVDGTVPVNLGATDPF
jgi:hypothetical protein